MGRERIGGRISSGTSKVVETNFMLLVGISYNKDKLYTKWLIDYQQLEVHF